MMPTFAALRMNILSQSVMAPAYNMRSVLLSIQSLLFTIPWNLSFSLGFQFALNSFADLQIGTHDAASLKLSR
jgi:hypothetical protein